MIDTKQFESALETGRYAQIHESDCLITLYNNGRIESHGSATYMKDVKLNRTFILTTSHLLNSPLQPTQRMTVTFDGTTEYPLEDYTTLAIGIHSPDNQDVQRKIQFNLGMDIAVGFIPSYSGSINPAQFPPFIMPADNDGSMTEYGYKKSQAICMKPEECSLAGYGKLIAPTSTKDVLVLLNNRENKKTLITLRAQSNADYNVTFGGGIRLVSIYQKPGSIDATPFEQPGRPGFSGASLRNKAGYVIGVASHVADGLITDDFREHHPYAGKIFKAAHKFIEYYSDPKYYSLPVACAGLATTYVFGNNWLGYLSFATTVVSSYAASYIPVVDNILWNYIVLPGAKSYFSATAVWEGSINEIVSKYWSTKNES